MSLDPSVELPRVRAEALGGAYDVSPGGLKGVDDFLLGRAASGARDLRRLGAPAVGEVIDADVPGLGRVRALAAEGPDGERLEFFERA